MSGPSVEKIFMQISEQNEFASPVQLKYYIIGLYQGEIARASTKNITEEQSPKGLEVLNFYDHLKDIKVQGVQEQSPNLGTHAPATMSATNFGVSNKFSFLKQSQEKLQRT